MHGTYDPSWAFQRSCHFICKYLNVPHKGLFLFFLIFIPNRINLLRTNHLHLSCVVYIQEHRKLHRIVYTCVQLPARPGSKVQVLFHVCKLQLRAKNFHKVLLVQHFSVPIYPIPPKTCHHKTLHPHWLFNLMEFIALYACYANVLGSNISLRRTEISL